MKIITFEDIQNNDITDPVSFYRWTKELLKLQYESLVPCKISIPYYNGDGFFNVMPGVFPSIETAGVKMIIRNPNHIPALSGDLMLYDSENDELLALMDSTYITAWRTGAMGAVATTTLAKSHFQSIGLVGMGNVGRAYLIVLLANVNRKLKINLLRHKGQEKELEQILIGRGFDVEFNEFDDFESLAKESDVIASAVTVTHEQFARPEIYKPGTLIVPMHTRGFQDCDPVFDRVIVDDKEGHVKSFGHFNEFKNCCNLCDVLINPKLGRQNDDERILAYNIGIALQDFYFARKIYDKLEKRIPDISLNKENIDKYWVK